MRLKTQRKVIYATMGLTVLALVGGFAAAALSLGYNTSYNEAAGTTTATYGTAFSTSAAPAIVPGGITGACTGDVPDVGTASSVAFEFYKASGTCNSGDDALSFVFHVASFTCPASASDTFTITSSGSNSLGPFSGVTNAFTVSCSTSTAYTGGYTFTVAIDFGGMATITSASIQITSGADTGF